MSKKKDPYFSKNVVLLKSIQAGLGAVIKNPIVVRACALAAQVMLEADTDFTARQAIQVQLVRSLNSVAANFTEGLGYSDQQQVIRFMKMARGSGYESCIHAECLGKYREDIQGLCVLLDDYLGALVVDALTQPTTTEEPE